MKLDILVLSSHPDDAELGCGGTMAAHSAKGYQVGVIDLTRGELGTRGSAEIREEEAKNASKILGLAVRENLGFKDGFFCNDEVHQLEIIKKIRKYKPEIIIANAPHDRHPDHGKAAELCYTASFLSGLPKVKTTDEQLEQAAWRPRHFYHFIQSNFISPDFIVDVSDYWEIKMKSVMAYATQFYNPESKEPETFISSEGFIKLIESRGREFGYAVGVKYGEGFLSKKIPAVNDLFNMI